MSPKSGDCALYGAERLRELPLPRLTYINTIVVAICLYSSLTRHAEEGAAQGLPQDVSFLTGQDVTSGHHILEGHECVVQDTSYEHHQQTTVTTASKKRTAESERGVTKKPKTATTESGKTKESGRNPSSAHSSENVPITQKAETQENISTTEKGKKKERRGPKLLGELRLPESDEEVPVKEREDSNLAMRLERQTISTAVEHWRVCCEEPAEEICYFEKAARSQSDPYQV